MSRRNKRGAAESQDREQETVGFRRRREKREQAVAFLQGDPLLVALDLAKRSHAAWITRKDLLPIKRKMVPHSHAGITAFLEELDHLRAKHECDRVIVFMEATSYFWQNVAQVLEARGIAYRTVAPLAVDRQREIEHLTYAKSDYRDAELIARLGAGGQWLHRVLEPDRLWLDLHALAIEHEVLLEAETAEQLRIRALLGVALPEFYQDFKDALGETARLVLRRLSTAPLPETYDALVERLRTFDGHRLRTGKVRALLGRLEAAPRFGVERALTSALTRIGLAVARFENFESQREGLRQTLVELLERTPYRAVLDSIPGVAPENHALTLGFIGDPKRYDRATCLSKLAGIEPRDNTSGDGEGAHSISHRGRTGLRSVLYRIVFGCQKWNPELGGYMKRLRTREKNPLAWHQAAMATANKYLRLVHHLCVSGEVYDASKLASRR
jgi:transposase